VWGGEALSVLDAPRPFGLVPAEHSSASRQGRPERAVCTSALRFRESGTSRPTGTPANCTHVTLTIERTPMTVPAPVRDLALLVARLAVGLVFFAHGWQKLFTNGIDGTAAFLDQVGVPAATAAAWFAAVVELAGGAALILGLAVPVAGLLLLVDMIGAFAFVHAGAGLFVEQGGSELVLTLGAAALLLAVTGAGRYGVDHLLLDRRRTAHRLGAESAPSGEDTAVLRPAA
jgi:putative oxidoreductase